MGYREVGVFENQGKLDGEFVDVMAMEKILIYKKNAFELNYSEAF